jgi:hypothetical protein
MTIREKEDTAKQILKILEERGKEYSDSRWHSYMLGSLEVLFEGVFSRLPDEAVEHYKENFKLKN